LEALLAAGGLGLALYMLFRFTRDLRPVGLTAWGLGISLVIAAMYFSYRYDLFTLAWFGVRRLYDYAAFPLILMALALVEAAVRALGRRLGWNPALIGAGLVVFVAAFLIPTARAPTAGAAQGIRRLDAVQWIREHAPCDARILLDQRTTGIFEAETGRQGLLEGMAPYLRPTMLHKVVGLLMDGRAFFRDPAGQQSFLINHGVDYVVLLRGDTLGYRGVIGGYDPRAVANLPSVQLVHSGPTSSIYRVVRPPGSTSPGALPNPASYPGYECRHGAIPLR